MNPTTPGEPERVRTIVVYGATGYTGRRVVAELLAHEQRVLVSGRDAGKLSRLTAEFGANVEVRPATFDDREALVALAREASAIINCAGPFSVSAPALAAAAVEGGAHYLDVSGEQHSALHLFDKVHGPACAANVTVLPGFAFNGAIGDMLATLAASEVGVVEDIEVGYRFTEWRPPTGSFQTRVEILEQEWFVHEGGRLQSRERWPTTRWFDFAPPVGRQRMNVNPISDVILLSRHVAATRISSWVNTETLAPKVLGPLLPFIANGSRVLLRSPARRLVEALLSTIWGSTETTASDPTTFVTAVRVRGSRGECRAEITGSGIYDLTAVMIVDAAIRLATTTRTLAGVRAPAEVFEPRAYLDRLGAHGARYTLGPPPAQTGNGDVVARSHKQTGTLVNDRSTGLALLGVLLAIHGVVSAVALAKVGYIGIFEQALATWGSRQVFSDLYVSLILMSAWMIVDARRKRFAAWPFVLLSPLIGWFAPLMYLFWREWKASARE